MRSFWCRGASSRQTLRFAAFAAWGSNVIDYLGADGGNDVAVSVDVHDLAGMQAAMASPEIAAAKEAHGVLDPIMVHVEKE